MPRSRNYRLVMEQFGETTVERLTMASVIGWLHFEAPVFLQPGEVFWVEGRTLHVRSPEGGVRLVEARPHRADDIR